MLNETHEQHSQRDWILIIILLFGGLGWATTVMWVFISGKNTSQDTVALALMGIFGLLMLIGALRMIITKER